eukprot:24267-Amphidinium_carterae.2
MQHGHGLAQGCPSIMRRKDNRGTREKSVASCTQFCCFVQSEVGPHFNDLYTAWLSITARPDTLAYNDACKVCPATNPTERSRPQKFGHPRLKEPKLRGETKPWNRAHPLCALGWSEAQVASKGLGPNATAHD